MGLIQTLTTSGSIDPWYNNDNPWGVSAPGGTGFVAMVTGEDLRHLVA
jgi:hypothetical protein